VLDIQLKQAGLTQAKLAKNLGISQNAVSKWQGNPPQYATAYLEQYIENRELKQGKAWMRRYLGLPKE